MIIANCDYTASGILGRVSSVCQVTGASPGFGYAVSHSHRRTKRRFDPNVRRRTFYVATLGRRVTLNVSVKGLRLIDKRGIDAVVRDLIKKGVKL